MKHDDWNWRYMVYVMNLNCNMKWFMNGLYWLCNENGIISLDMKFEIEIDGWIYEIDVHKEVEW